MQGSTLFMYCAGPASKDTIPVLRLLVRVGANPKHRNDAGRSAVAYVKAWRAHQVDPRDRQLHSVVLEHLKAWGCDMSEESVF